MSNHYDLRLTEVALREMDERIAAPVGSIRRRLEWIRQLANDLRAAKVGAAKAVALSQKLADSYDGLAYPETP